jgi:alpha-galactosidase
MTAELCFLLLLLCVTPSRSLDNGVGLTPPMGWNSWNAFHCDIDEKLIQSVANRIVELGLDTLGYNYVNLDDCWMKQARVGGKYVGDPDRFPSGMKAIGDFLHGLNLHFGIYTSAGTKTCAGFPGSLHHEQVDAQTFADWGVDYLKYDNCYSWGIPAIDRYSKMRDALNETGRPIFFSLCQWGLDESWKWAPAVGHAWRTTNDIESDWGSIQGNFWESQRHAERSGTGAWLDPDMLEVGNGQLTREENESHFSLWCFAKAPLLLGNNLLEMTDQTLEILSNRNLIAINQDPGAKQATCFLGCDPSAKWSVFATKLTGGDVVALYMNWSSDVVMDATLAGSDVGVVPRPNLLVQVTDMWTDRVVGHYSSESLKRIPIPPLAPHASVVYRLIIQESGEGRSRDSLLRMS